MGLSSNRANRVANWSLSTAWALGMIIVSAAAQSLKVPDTLGTHDPSRVIADKGSYYFYGTSSGVSGWYTTNNGSSWKNTPSLLSKLPADVIAAVPQNDGHEVWAPDVIWNPNTNLFHVYYAVPSSNSGTHLHSATALITSPTLDPDTAVWTDRGPVIVSTHDVTQYSSIDPCPFFDLDGNMWMSFGSAYTGNKSAAISVIALDKTTGLRSDDQVHVVQGCACEASAVYPHDGYYYLFWNTGGCCSGASSTYTIHMARSTSVTGSYSGNQIFLSSTSSRHGPGQIGFITIDGKDYYSYHYYPDSGGSVLGFAPLTWTSSGWPSA